MEPFDFEKPTKSRRGSAHRMPALVWFSLGIAFMGCLAVAIFFLAPRGAGRGIMGAIATARNESPEAVNDAIESHIAAGHYDLIWDRLSGPSQAFWTSQADGRNEQAAKNDFVMVQKVMKSAVDMSNKKRPVMKVASVSVSGDHAKLTLEGVNDGKKIQNVRQLVKEGGEWKLDALAEGMPWSPWLGLLPPN